MHRRVGCPSDTTTLHKPAAVSAPASAEPSPRPPAQESGTDRLCRIRKQITKFTLAVGSGVGVSFVLSACRTWFFQHHEDRHDAPPSTAARHASAAAPAVGAGTASAHAGLRTAIVLIAALLLLTIARLPWSGDLGLHAATIERLRHDLLSPGNPMVDANTASPYYSPWMVLLGALAKLTGLGPFMMLRISGMVSLVLLCTGVWQFTRTFTRHRSAPALAILCLLLLWGPHFVAWSGFLGLGSLALTISYPSTFALALAFHLWSLLTKAVRARATWSVFLGLGLMWAAILLCHQFSGVVATFGALGVLLGARPWPVRETWLRLSGGLVVGLALLTAWPYYSFFSLFGTGGLDGIHRSLYRDLPLRYAFVLIGVVALALRAHRNRRDPLVVFFAFGALVVAAGAASGHWSWGRVLPAAVIPAQLATALAAVEKGTRFARTICAGVTGTALLFGAWTQAGTLGYVVRGDALPKVLERKMLTPWADYRWITPWVKYGDTVITKNYFASRMVPAYGAYTVAPGYPDFFLSDERKRRKTVERYFAPGATRADRIDALHRYHAKWIIQTRSEGGLPEGDQALRETAVGPTGQVLYKVVGR
ncbi:hypothetical protein GCM10010252_61430 [Streptomyces aureoverticillatus]|nr:hypothetical protein GCM10010252_61430 [Streptomyces aureoverticillatus]